MAYVSLWLQKNFTFKPFDKIEMLLYEWWTDPVGIHQLFILFSQYFLFVWRPTYSPLLSVTNILKLIYLYN